MDKTFRKNKICPRSLSYKATILSDRSPPLDMPHLIALLLTLLCCAFSQAAAITEKTDRYGRGVGKVLIDGVDANLEQVRRGLAWHYQAYQREQSPSDRLD